LVSGGFKKRGRGADTKKVRSFKVVGKLKETDGIRAREKAKGLKIKHEAETE